MIRGMISGLLSGTAISAALLAGISLMLPPPGQGPGPENVAAGTTADKAAPVAEPAPDEAVAVEAATVEAATAEAATGAEVAETAEPAEPATEAAVAQAETEPVALEPAAEPAADPAAEPTAEPAVASATEAAPPADPAPAAEPAEAIPETATVKVPAGSEFTRPKAEEPAALPGTDQTAAATVAPQVPEAGQDVAPDLAGLAPDAAPSAGPEPVAPAAPEPPAGEAMAAKPATDARPGTELTEATAPAAEAAPAVATEAPAAPARDDAGTETPDAVIAGAEEPAPAPDSPAETAPADSASPEPSPEPEPSDVPPMIVADAPEPPQGVVEAPKPGFKNAPGVKVNRLPSIGDTPVAGAAEVAEAPSVDPADVPPIARYAAKFDDPGAAALVAVILIDLGAQGADMAGATPLGLPVTVAIDPNAPDAGSRASALRSAGMEVAIQVKDLPRASSASDIEVAYQAMRSAVGEAVGLFGAPGSGMIEDSRQADHFVALAKADGLGLFSLTGGLNALARDAESEGVPHAEVERQADADGADSRAIRRALDRAVFEATQTGEAVVALESSAASLNALVAWVKELPESVALVPASAVAVRSVDR